MKTISLELQILIESIRIVFLQHENEKLNSLVNNPKINWERLHRLTIYHQIRPVVYEALKQINFTNDFVALIGFYTKKRAIQNIFEGQELIALIAILKENDIKALPYKGTLFLHKIYHNKPLRESRDIDLLVKPDDALKALKLLRHHGYSFSRNLDFSDDSIKKILTKNPSSEVSLSKKHKGGIYRLDFHWHIQEAPQYSINIADFFDQTITENIQGKNIALPSPEFIFGMLLNHHGGREFWVVLKHLCDLISFYNAYHEIKIEQLEEIAVSMKMKTIFRCANLLLYHFFQYNPQHQKTLKVQNHKVMENIVVMWEKAKLWDKILPKLRLYKIYKTSQDGDYSWNSLIINQLEFLSKVNPIERKRLFVFPDNWVILNAFSKLLTYLWNRVKINF